MKTKNKYTSRIKGGQKRQQRILGNYDSDLDISGHRVGLKSK